LLRPAIHFDQLTVRRRTG